ncbi:hypothetical protein QQG55_44920 [Brugia pahangi]
MEILIGHTSFCCDNDEPTTTRNPSFPPKLFFSLILGRKFTTIHTFVLFTLLNEVNYDNNLLELFTN